MVGGATENVKERAEVFVVVDNRIQIDTGGRAAVRWLNTKDIVAVMIQGFYKDYKTYKDIVAVMMYGRPGPSPWTGEIAAGPGRYSGNTAPASAVSWETCLWKWMCNMSCSAATRALHPDPSPQYAPFALSSPRR